MTRMTLPAAPRAADGDTAAAAAALVAACVWLCVSLQTPIVKRLNHSAAYKLLIHLLQH
jgi:hypothetical protein